MQTLDTGTSTLVSVDERLPTVDDPDTVNPIEVANLVRSRRDGVFRAVPLAAVDLDGEPPVGPATRMMAPSWCYAPAFSVCSMNRSTSLDC